MERYSKQEKAGQGTYGVVYKSWDNEAKEFVALKVQCAVGVRKLFRSDGYPDRNGIDAGYDTNYRWRETLCVQGYLHRRNLS